MTSWLSICHPSSKKFTIETIKIFMFCFPFTSIDTSMLKKDALSGLLRD